MATKFNYQGREFELSNQIENGKLVRTIINDGGLEFPFPNYEKASEFLADEYGGSKDDAFAVLSEAEPLDGVEVSGTATVVSPEKKSKKSAGKKPAKEKKEKAPKEPKPVREIEEHTFELAGKQVTKKIQKKTILPDQTPERVEDVDLDEVYHLHIDVYSKKNRTSTLTNKETGEVVIAGVSLMDAIYAYAEKVGMTFAQADKYIKIKRGLLPEPEKKPAKGRKVTAEDLKGGAAEEVQQ